MSDHINDQTWDKSIPVVFNDLQLGFSYHVCDWLIVRCARAPTIIDLTVDKFE